VCIACSQFEKLRARLLNIRQQQQQHQTLQQQPSAQQEEKDMASDMQKELHECVSHHQLILK
jgi:ribosome-binding protein aMBF1 (putative translation factor)